MTSLRYYRINAFSTDILQTCISPNAYEVQMIHGYRDSLVKERTALANRVRGYLREMGLFIPQGLSNLRKNVPIFLEDTENELTITMRTIISNCYNRLLELDNEIKQYTQKIEAFCKQSSTCQRLMKLSGVGPMVASIVYSTIGEPKNFKNGRHFAAYLGLVPREHSSGGRQKLMSISKRGDCYIRSLLVHGGRAVIRTANRKNDYYSRWVQRLCKERGNNKAAVAVANKNARHMWAIMAYGDKYVNVLDKAA